MTEAADRGEALEQAIGEYNAAWNRQDLDAIVAAHAPNMVFENHTAGERVEGATVGDHIAAIFGNWPDLSFSTRRLHARDGLVVCEWTATATNSEGERLEWDGLDLFSFENGLITRKDVYSASNRARVVGRADPASG